MIASVWERWQILGLVRVACNGTWVFMFANDVYSRFVTDLPSAAAFRGRKSQVVAWRVWIKVLYAAGYGVCLFLLQEFLPLAEHTGTVSFSLSNRKSLLALSAQKGQQSYLISCRGVVAATLILVIVSFFFFIYCKGSHDLTLLRSLYCVKMMWYIAGLSEHYVMCVVLRQKRCTRPVCFD